MPFSRRLDEGAPIPASQIPFSSGVERQQFHPGKPNTILTQYEPAEPVARKHAGRLSRSSKANLSAQREGEVTFRSPSSEPWRSVGGAGHLPTATYSSIKRAIETM